MMQLQVKHLYKSYAQARSLGWISRRHPVLEDISFSLTLGNSLGIIGESGSGKSTLARLLCGLDDPDRGEILLKGQPLSRHRRDRHRLIQLVFQNSQAAMNPRKTIQQILTAPIQYLTDMKGADQTAHLHHLLDQVGLSSDYLHRRPHELSGGQAQRVGIARALACSPSILVLDEPTSALDVSIQAQILDLLSQLQEQHQVTMIFISHDLAVVERLCEFGLVLKSGKIVEQGAIAALYQNPQAEYTQRLLDSSLNLWDSSA